MSSAVEVLMTDFFWRCTWAPTRNIQLAAIYVIKTAVVVAADIAAAT